MTGRLEILGEDGEWHEVPGITSVEFEPEQPEPEQGMTLQQFVEQTRPLRQAYVQVVHAYAEAARPVVEAAARGIEAYGRVLRQAGLIDQEGRFAVRQDRPAWHSPGPPPRRT
ncbi:hypothetical protein [Streptomyces arenae]|uniref:hypothetical protein n=1 Tax=Streptomyces arenae TaxID=29301 RepID=UPI002659E8B8|nr:hypothetical protein [Streptomyces arenae]MCG7203990.1 hypothetical protein [Streptomyces arenae]